MSEVLWFNDAGARALGFTASAAPALMDAAPRQPRTLAIPGRFGLWLGASAPIVGARSLRIGGTIAGDSLADGLAKLDRVKAALGDGLIEIRHVWAPGRVLRGVLTQANAGPDQRAWLGYLACDLEFLLADPFAYDVEPSLVAFGSSQVAIPLGTAPSIGQSSWSAVISIFGAATTPTLTYYDASGTAVSTMAFTWSPAVNLDSIEIDVGRGLITRVQNAVRDNGLPYVSAGWEFPRLAPSDGDYYTSGFPRLSVSSGSALIRYHRAWL